MRDSYSSIDYGDRWRESIDGMDPVIEGDDTAIYEEEKKEDIE
jgi:hypothetical protein